MDQTTLDWITANRPSFPDRPSQLPHAPLLLIPPTEWFFDARIADSIHGVLHGARVSMLASLLAGEYDLSRKETAVLCAAAAMHDCRRRHDRDDVGHGRRAARWFARYHQTVSCFFDFQLPVGLIAPAATAVALHDVPYDAFSAEQTHAYAQARQFTDLLKAADCLDRYRLPRDRWWPDTTRLRIRVPAWLPQVAFDLVTASEQHRLDGASPDDALAHARLTLYR
ncbi:hypothetical protein [Streptomyces sp. V3I7]|uniref:hypothetical protein n=1 Tax=Streptomyces sp. V3I7 TaxID=3042278 RepID=UPI0027D82E02|nr:hypothetical protein [Streptomyces sp. V3I7]